MSAGIIALSAGCGAGAAPLDLGMWLQPADVDPSAGLLRPVDVDMLGPGMEGVEPDASDVALSAQRRGPCGASMPPWPDDAGETVTVIAGTDARLVQSVGRAGAASNALHAAVAADLRFGCAAFETEREPGQVSRVDRVTPVTGLPAGATAWTSRVSAGDESAWEGAVWVRAGSLYASLAIRAEHRPQPPAMRALVATVIAALEHGQARPSTADT